MAEFLKTSTAQAVIWTAVLVFFIALACFVVLKFRDRAFNDQGAATDLLSNFQEMEQQGDISDAEFRTIKTMLGTKFQRGLKDNGEKGSSKST
jgi:hypothetical protein